MNDAISFYTERGLQLGRCEPLGKVPVYGAMWQRESLTHAAAAAHVEDGGNLSWVIGRGYVVLDVDGRNNGVASLRRLEAQLGVKLSEITRTVRTGNGYHYYFRCDSPLGSKIPGYEGIDVKRYGGYVLIPPSRHPTWTELARVGYEFENDLDIAELPAAAVDLLTYKLEKVDPSTPGLYTIDDIVLCLSQMDIKKYGKKHYDDWLRVMCAVHHSVGGSEEGFQAFKSWCDGDPLYEKADREEWRDSWNALKLNKPGAATFGTLRHYVVRDGGSTADIDLRAAFDGVVVAADSETVMGDLNDGERYNADTPMQEWRDLLSSISGLSPLDQEEVLQRIHEQSGKKLSLPLLRKELKHLAAANGGGTGKDADMIRYLGGKCLSEYWYNGDTLIVTPEDIRYEYKGGWWRALGDPLFEQSVQKLCSQHNKTSMVSQVAKFVNRECVRERDPFLVPATDSVFCMEDGEMELEMDGSTYRLTKREHRPESMFLSQMPVSIARMGTDKCPVYEAFMESLFQDKEDDLDIVRHLEEVFGYMSQKIKPDPVFLVFRGSGANGKSTLGGVINRVLGDQCVSMQLSALNQANNKHATAYLVGKLVVIDDDFPSYEYLPDAEIKKISEQKEMRAEPKYKAPFDYICHATPIILTNRFPRLRENTVGLHRRTHCIEFSQDFRGGRGDLDLYLKLDAERHAIFKRWLDGFVRYKQRGHFIVPESFKRDVDLWMDNSRPIVEWAGERLEDCDDADSILVADALTDYRNWCQLNQLKFVQGKTAFIAELGGAGYKIHNRNSAKAYKIGGKKLKAGV